jgi:hypothetical protein
MRAMEGADAKVHDADADRADIIGGPAAIGRQSTKRTKRQADHCFNSFASEPTSQIVAI